MGRLCGLVSDSQSGTPRLPTPILTVEILLKWGCPVWGTREPQRAVRAALGTELQPSVVSFGFCFKGHLLAAPAAGQPRSDRRVDSTDVARGSRLGVCGPRATFRSSPCQASGRSARGTVRVWGLLPRPAPLPAKRSVLFLAQGSAAGPRAPSALPSTLADLPWPRQSLMHGSPGPLGGHPPGDTRPTDTW